LFDAALAGLTLSTLLLGMWMLRYGASSPAVWFLLSWLFASFSLFLTTFQDRYPLMAATHLAHGTVAATLVYAGVRLLVERPVPAWFLPAALGYGLLQSLLASIGQPELAMALGLPILLLAGAAGIVALRERSRKGRTLALRVLGALLIAVFAAAIGTQLDRLVFANASAGWLLLWPLVASALLAVELWAVAEHHGNRLRRRQQELEQLVDERSGVIARIDESLTASEERYRAVSELSSDFSFSLRVDPDGSIRREWVTEAFERITGHPPEILDGEGWPILLGGEPGAVSETERERLLARVDESRIEYEVVRPDGSTRWLDVVLRAVRSEADGRLRVLGAARDVTEARAAEETRRDLERQVEAAERMESLGMLAGGIAHDFNNLLAVILGNVRLVQDELPPDLPAADRLAKIHAAAEHAARLTEQLLTYSGKAIVTRAPLELSGLIRDLQDLLDASLDPSCRLRFELCEDLVVEGDATRLSQVVLNLVTNAGEAVGADGGEIVVQTGREELDARALAGTVGDGEARPGEYAFIEVADDGAGMDPETSQRIFEPFFTTKFSGRGLGLASALGIIRAHGGCARLVTAPGEGTRIRVLLPVSVAVPTPEREAPQARREAPEEPERVLVVDDDEAVLELASEFLRRAGYVSQPATGGVEALERFREDPQAIQVVVLDLTMPDMDGREVFRELRSIRPDLPVVLATGYSRGALEESFPDERGVHFLRKPYEPEQLLDAIQRARSDSA
jgi:PAS domain S-box-containing protein